MKICFMCRLNVKKTININGECEKGANILTILLKHFWFAEDVLVNEAICNPCEKEVTKFHKYYESVEETHKNFIVLPEVKLDNDNGTEEDIKSEIKEEFDDSDDELDTDNLFAEIPDLEESSEDDYKPDEKSDDGDEIVREKPAKRRKKSTVRKEKKVSQFETDEFLAQDALIKEYIHLECHVCHEKQDSFTKLRMHVTSTHREKGFALCCNRKFFKRCHLLQHIDWHKQPQKVFPCTLCDSNWKYKSEKALMSHIQEKHGPEEAKTYFCEKCPKRFASEKKLREHSVRHNERTFICQEEGCGKAFGTSYNLNTHMQVHRDDNRFICDICSKSLRGKGNFMEHIKTHTEEGQKKVQCTICGVWIKNLKKHMKLHTAVSTDDFRCDVCGKTCPNHGALQSHIKYNHLTERKHKCTFCEKAFKRERELIEHTATHTGAILYTCPYCPKTFNSHANMHSHKKRVHREQWEQFQGPKRVTLKDYL